MYHHLKSKKLYIKSELCRGISLRSSLYMYQTYILGKLFTRPYRLTRERNNRQ